MDFYPIFINLKEKLCVVVGGGRVAERKILTLLNYNCKIKVISLSFTEKILKLRDRIEIIKDGYRDDYLEGAFLVFACTDDKDLNNRIFNDARIRGILTNNATSNTDTDFIVPSIVKRGKINIAISTEGASPALNRILKEKIEKVITEDYSYLAEVLEKIRKKQLTINHPSDKNREKFYEFLNSDALKFLNDKKKLNEIIKKIFGFEVEL